MTVNRLRDAFFSPFEEDRLLQLVLDHLAVEPRLGVALPLSSIRGSQA